jgi:hypothetical protein
MAQYEYAGPGPIGDGDGGIVRPGDVREFGAEPDWGPWRLLDEPPEAAETPSQPPATGAPAPPPVSPGAASTPPPAPTTGE